MKTRRGAPVNRNFSAGLRGSPKTLVGRAPAGGPLSPLDNHRRLFYRKSFGEGKTVQFRRGPAAVTGDERRQATVLTNGKAGQ